MLVLAGHCLKSDRDVAFRDERPSLLAQLEDRDPVGVRDQRSRGAPSCRIASLVAVRAVHDDSSHVRESEIAPAVRVRRWLSEVNPAPGRRTRPSGALYAPKVKRINDEEVEPEGMPSDLATALWKAPHGAPEFVQVGSVTPASARNHWGGLLE